MARYLQLLVLLCLAASASSFACSCGGPMSTCGALTSDVAFVGQVIEIKPSDRKGEFIGMGLARGYSMRFSVEESFRGALGTEITIETGAGGGDCGTPLKPGSRFVIFARKTDSGELWTGLCSGNRELNSSPEGERFLNELRAVAATRKSSISGSVWQELQEIGIPADYRKSMPGVVVLSLIHI